MITIILQESCTKGDLNTIKRNNKDCSLAIQLCNNIIPFMQILHKNNIVHRDIKPDNILLCSIFKLIDYGFLSKINTIDPKIYSGTIAYTLPSILKSFGINKNYYVNKNIYLYSLANINIPYTPNKIEYLLYKNDEYAFASTLSELIYELYDIYTYYEESTNRIKLKLISESVRMKQSYKVCYNKLNDQEVILIEDLINKLLSAKLCFSDPKFIWNPSINQNNSSHFQLPFLPFKIPLQLQSINSKGGKRKK